MGENDSTAKFWPHQIDFTQELEIIVKQIMLYLPRLYFSIIYFLGRNTYSAPNLDNP